MNKTQIANAALRLLGIGTRVSDLDTDTSAQAQVIRDQWEQTLNAALARYRWTFARVESAQLAQLTSQTADGYDRYQLPAGVLALTRVYDGNGEEVPFRLDGTTLVVAEQYGDEVYAGYIQDPGEGALPAYFTRALSLQLAADAAVALTASRTTAEYLEQLARDAWAAARRTDRQSAGPASLVKEDEMTLLSVRRG